MTTVHHVDDALVGCEQVIPVPREILEDASNPGALPQKRILRT